MEMYFAGAEPASLPETGSEKDQQSWWETPFGRWRLSVERQAMSRFPQFRLTCTPHGQLAWIGRLRSALDPTNAYLVHVTYSPHFPEEPPIVAIKEPDLPVETPHMLNGGRPCLFYPSDGPRYGYDPARTTAATLLAWTALWIHAFETWRAIDVWPGRSA